MGSGVGTQQMLLVDIVAVRLLATDMVRGNEKVVKVLLHSDHWIQLIIDGKEGVPALIAIRSVKVVNNALADDGQGVILLQVFVGS